MTSQYEIIEIGNFQPILQRTDQDGKVWNIPMVAGNADYKEYLNPTETKATK
jgi:hypothetical protein